MAKSPAKRGPTGQSGTNRNAKPVARSGRPAGLFTWLAIGLVVVVIVGVVAYKVLSGSNSDTNTKVSGTFQATSATIVAELTQIPLSTFDAVGVNSPTIGVTAPTKAKGQKLLQWADSQGIKRPTIFYFGSEYAPFCAAQRWSSIIALSRFGNFTNLGNTVSSHTDQFPDTQSFTFVKATFKSKFINFASIENLSNVPIPSSPYFTTLQIPNKAEVALITKYDTTTYIPGSRGGTIPFMSFANQFFVAGSSYSPSSLEITSRDAVAAILADPTNSLTQGILTSANLQTAAICSITHQNPGSVCLSKGVQAADRVMGLM